MADIRAVLFDYGLVLSAPPDAAAWQHFKDVLQTEETAFHAAYWAYRDAYDNGSLTGAAYWRSVARDLQQTLTEQQLTDLIATDVTLWTQPNQPMIDWACSLPTRGIRTGILSNIGDEMETGILARCPWLAGFTHHTFSHRLRIAKPDPAIYSYAAEGLGVSPAEILFIDDRAVNINAARAAEMRAIQYTDHDEFVSAMQKEGISDLLK